MSEKNSTQLNVENTTQYINHSVSSFLSVDSIAFTLWIKKKSIVLRMYVKKLFIKPFSGPKMIIRDPFRYHARGLMDKASALGEEGCGFDPDRVTLET